ncbi:unnamed protein product [Nippostrongylus brasiliensis]|uniref:Transposase n=1 Tax=Nippostrongylus brasiliensis TaxID=27835 RepID=A0A0N4Y1I7_NIPBR|nr:hypothetical protein Q1695_008680 [Nippostrongylus brasiliensis]VDL73078.1 unnamed protein product [Nippostrongylus brasiliensis]
MPLYGRQKTAVRSSPTAAGNDEATECRQMRCRNYDPRRLSAIDDNAAIRNQNGLDVADASLRSFCDESHRRQPATTII